MCISNLNIIIFLIHIKNYSLTTYIQKQIKIRYRSMLKYKMHTFPGNTQHYGLLQDQK